MGVNTDWINELKVDEEAYVRSGGFLVRDPDLFKCIVQKITKTQVVLMSLTKPSFDVRISKKTEREVGGGYYSFTLLHQTSQLDDEYNIQGLQRKVVRYLEIVGCKIPDDEKILKELVKVLEQCIPKEVK